MRSARNTAAASAQTDLFRPASPQPDLFDGGAEPYDDPKGRAELVTRFRVELADTLARTRAARGALPWANLTAATIAELRFMSISTWLPHDEGEALRVAFQAELTRLYDEIDAASD